MARTVADAALMLSAIAGSDARSPIAIGEAGDRFARPLDRDFRRTKLAWSRDLGGLPVDPRVTAVLEGQRGVFADLGCIVTDDEPDLSGADEVFQAWRAWIFELGHGDLMAEHRDQLKATIVWNIEQGQQLSGPTLARAERRRTELYHEMRRFLERYEFLLLPVSQVPPFDINQEYPTEINGQPMATYVDWIRICSDITITGLPAISVPCGFTTEGLPVGLQIVGRHHDDLGVLQLAHAFEQATGVWRQRPPVVA